MGKRLFEAMVEANHRALAGDTEAGLHPGDYEDELPLVALTCVDARLNALLPQVLGVPAEQFIWLRNAGNIITGPMSSTMRSLALACVVKGGKEIVIIGHTDCQVGKTTTMQLIDRFRALGVERHMLPDNLNDYFGMFASDRQNVLKAVEVVRSSPLIGPKIPVQGLLVEIETGRLEWLVNGYQSLGAPSARLNLPVEPVSQAIGPLKPLAGFNFGEMKFPEAKIGDVVSAIGDEITQRLHRAAEALGARGEVSPQGSPSAKTPLPTGFSLGGIRFPETKIGEVVTAIGEGVSQRIHRTHVTGAEAKAPQPSSVPPKIPLPPPLRPKMHLRRNPK